jgi:PH domain
LKITSHHSNSRPLTSPRSANATSERKSCSQCDAEFNWFTLGRSQLCARCNQRYCRPCFGSAGRKSRAGGKTCLQCVSRQKAVGGRSIAEDMNTVVKQQRQNLLATPASSKDRIKASYVKFKGAGASRYLERFFVLRRNFCLYSYKSESDHTALAMLPLAGCDIQQGTSDRHSFSIRHASRVYHVLCANESDHAEWMAALILSANAKLPTETVPLATRQQNGSAGRASNGCVQGGGKYPLLDGEEKAALVMARGDENGIAVGNGKEFTRM